jgi:hypothetical protein
VPCSSFLVKISTRAAIFSAAYNSGFKIALYVAMESLQKFQSQQKRVGLRQPSLLLCVIFDLVGYASYSVPILGEFADIIWAPVSGLIFFVMFGGWKGAVGGMFNFLEELLPGTDFIPSFTIMWVMRYMQNRDAVKKQTSFS